MGASSSPADVVTAARKLFSAGDALAALDLLDAMASGSHTLQSRQLLAACALRGGAHSQARQAVSLLVEQGHHDEETLGLVAREAKARWQQGETGALVEARDAYRRAFRATGGLWSGINAATLSLFAGETSLAQGLAREVLQAREALPPARKSEFWTVASGAEAALVLGDEAVAMAGYRQALAMEPAAFGDLRSMRDSARAIARARGQAPEWLAHLFPSATVAVFTGHMVDAPGRATPRFPAADEGSAALAIADAIEAQAIDIGVSAAANGADILFLEALQALGKETRVVLPFPAEEFRLASVTAGADESWGMRFDRVLARADQVTVVGPHPGEDLGYQFHGVVMAGTALLRAEAVDGRVVALGLWDGAPGGVGGAAALLSEWAGRGIQTVVLPFADQPARQLSPETAHASLRGTDVRAASGQRIVSLLFADAVGFSQLDERQVHAFVLEFWGRVARLLHGAHASELLHANTWGDGLFLVLGSAPAAAQAALAISAVVRETDWSAVGLPAGTAIRIALHAGPAYELDDPITGAPNYAGMHISRAARIEPVTPAGEIYASEAFAALLAFDDGQARFRCEYVGTVPLAKSYGRMRMYRLNRRPVTN